MASEQNVIAWTVEPFRAEWDGRPSLIVLLPWEGAERAAAQIFPHDDALMAELHRAGVPERPAYATALANARADCTERSPVNRLHLHRWLEQQPDEYVRVEGVTVNADLLQKAVMILTNGDCAVRANATMLWLSDNARTVAVMGANVEWITGGPVDYEREAKS